jgi:DNA-binding NtrC family response regulator
VPYEHGRTAQRLPAWLRRPIAHAGEYRAVEGLLDELHLATVCQEAKCPNRGECYASGTATFLIAGDACTRGCRFCAVETRGPAPLDADEPARVAEAGARLARGEAAILDELTQAYEKTLIEVALRHTGGRRIEAAHLLGWGRNTLTRKIHELGMDAVPEADETR